jgi:CheY-like chemotaxis protein
MVARRTDGDGVDVLIAEDDVLVRQTLRLFLEREGYRCAEAGDGGAAVELARRQAPRCAILDLAMPVMDGFAVARALRADPRTRAIHLHCITGRSDPSAQEEATRAGMETCLTKPFDPSLLVRTVRRHLRQPDVIEASGLSLDEARQQLDVWESDGFGGLEATYKEGQGFTVRCVRPPTP